MTDHEGHALAMETIIRSLMATHCRDPKHPTKEEMVPVLAELKAIDAATRAAD